jgi:PAS domain-containing protein
MWQEIEQLKEINEKLDRKQLTFLQNSNCLTSFMLTLPMPAWVKDLNGRMMFCNYKYETSFGISPTKYNGKLDSAVWSKDESREFRKNDLEVEKQRIPVKFKEKIFNEKLKEWQELEVVKWPVTIGGFLLGIAGMVLHERTIRIKGVK